MKYKKNISVFKQEGNFTELFNLSGNASDLYPEGAEFKSSPDDDGRGGKLLYVSM
jgi:hypothetical protein